MAGHCTEDTSGTGDDGRAPWLPGESSVRASSVGHVVERRCDDDVADIGRGRRDTLGEDKRRPGVEDLETERPSRNFWTKS